MPRRHASRFPLPIWLGALILTWCTACASTATVPGESTIPRAPRATVDRQAAIDDALVVWADFWVDAINGPHNDVARQNAAELATDRVLEEAGAPFTDSVTRRVVSQPIAVAQSDGSVILDDCLTFDPPLAETESIWFSGRVRPDGDAEQRIDVLTLEVIDCTADQLTEGR